MQGYSRRQFLGLLALGALPTAARAVARVGDLPPPVAAEATLAARLAALFAQRDSARIVGRRYLAAAPAEADAEQLAQLLCGTPERYRQLQTASHEDLQDFLARQQRRDFETGGTVSVDGWLLSQTEARLCAITALSG